MELHRAIALSAHPFPIQVRDQHLVYRLRKPTVDGRTELILTPPEFLDRLTYLVTPPRVHKHRYCGVLAPNAKLR
ncbi:MAG: transposase [Candidatus Krumholzibacteriia bacterium]